MISQDLIVVVAASAEILLKKPYHLCVIGEGEKSFLNVLRRAEETHEPENFIDIPGLALLQKGEFINTGYETALPAGEVWDIDLGDLERTTDVSKIFHKVFDDDGNPLFEWFANDPRAFEPHRREKTMDCVCKKGCVPDALSAIGGIRCSCRKPH